MGAGRHAAGRARAGRTGGKQQAPAASSRHRRHGRAGAGRARALGAGGRRAAGRGRRAAEARQESGARAAWALGLATGCALGALGLFSIRLDSVFFLSQFLDIVLEPSS